MLNRLVAGLDERETKELKREWASSALLRQQITKVLEEDYHKAAQAMMSDSAFGFDWKNYRAKKAGEAAAYKELQKYFK